MSAPWDIRYARTSDGIDVAYATYGEGPDVVLIHGFTHIAARVMALAGPDEVLASRTVKDLAAGSGIEFTDRGSNELKGIPGSWDIYAVSAPN